MHSIDWKLDACDSCDWLTNALTSNPHLTWFAPISRDESIYVNENQNDVVKHVDLCFAFMNFTALGRDGHSKSFDFKQDHLGS